MKIEQVICLVLIAMVMNWMNWYATNNVYAGQRNKVGVILYIGEVIIISLAVTIMLYGGL